MILSHTFASLNPGKKLLFFGRIHGDEPCGTEALMRVKKELEEVLVLKQGSITMIPVCNPQGKEVKKRQVNENLNRVFRRTDQPSSYEQQLANVLTQYVDQTDILVDLHSGHTENAYFVFQDYQSPECEELVKASAIPTVITGRPELYEDTGDMDTISYAHNQGKSGIVIEGGQHDDPASIDRTYHAIMNILKHYGMIEGSVTLIDQKKIQMDKTYYKQSEGKLSREYVHGDMISQGDVLATYENGGTIVAPRDSVMILPKNYDVKTNAERFYLGHII